MEIRDARLEDALAGTQVLRRSILELCVADHRNDPAILARWLSNKTPEMFMSWLAQPGNSVLVALEDGHVLAVGSVTDAGQINLNYVSPDARFRGVSRALLHALERRAVERGNERCVLISTETARRFYHANGYAETGPPVGEFGTVAGYPMQKWLGDATAQAPHPAERQHPPAPASPPDSAPAPADRDPV
jgi:GNAT superfamily N-acetyltransferase